MNKEKILEAMNHIDPAFIEEADRPVPEVRRVKWSRSAIIAACLCVVLAGTALAVGISGTRITGIFQDPEHPHYTYVNDIYLHPVSDFSEKLLKTAAKRKVQEKGQFAREFRTFEEEEEFVGINMMDNPMLEAADQETERSVEGTADEWTLHLLIMDCIEAGPTRIKCHDNYRLGDVLILMNTILYTDLAQDIPEDGLLEEQANYCSHTELLLEDHYTAPSGLEAEIVKADVSHTPHAEEPFGNVQYTANFNINGIPFSVHALASDVENLDDAHVLSVLKEVLDAFVCEPTE